MKILSLGNSFGKDAQRYLHRIAAKNGHELKCVNLYIGGCPLRLHYLNMLDDVKNYSFEFNGETTGIYVSLREALKSDEWDYVTLQQTCHKSVDYDTYTPYLEKLADYVSVYSPKTKIMLHHNWAYQDGSPLLASSGYSSTEEMFADIRKAYSMAAASLGGVRMIPAGQAMLEAQKRCPQELYRDGMHASLGFGQYLLGLTWYRTLFGEHGSITHLDSFDEPISKAGIEAAESISAAVTADLD